MIHSVKRFIHWFTLLSTFAIFASFAVADDQMNSPNMRKSETTTTTTTEARNDNARMSDRNESGKMTDRSDSNMSMGRPMEGQQRAAMASNKAQQTLAPHSLMISSALHSALDEVQGLKSQLDVVPMANSKESMEHIRAYRRSIRDDLTRVSTHTQHLQSNIKKFPELAKTDEYSAVDTALNDVKGSRQMTLSKMENESYWKNKDQAKSDLDQLESRLRNAIDKTKSFNSKIDVHANIG